MSCIGVNHPTIVPAHLVYAMLQCIVARAVIMDKQMVERAEGKARSPKFRHVPSVTGFPTAAEVYIFD